MADPHYMSLGDDSGEDLPRTFRREKEARAREARERAEQERASAPPSLGGPSGADSASPPAPAEYPASLGQAYDSGAAYGGIDDMPFPASVRRFDVPFFHLMLFFLKAVFAAVPALIVLGTMLWFGGQLLEAMFPELIKMKILITFPN